MPGKVQANVSHKGWKSSKNSKAATTEAAWARNCVWTWPVNEALFGWWLDMYIVVLFTRGSSAPSFRAPSNCRLHVSIKICIRVSEIILPCNGTRLLCKQKELKEAKLWMVNQFDLILLCDIMNWNISLRKEKKMACVNRQLSTTSSLTENWGPNMAMPLQAEDFPSVLKNIKAHMLLHHLNK